jgi:CDP-diacylglycerol--serine O-phosphatidyltransferase
MSKQIPNIFTLLNLIFGCLAIIMTLQQGIVLQMAEETGMHYVDIPEKIWMASLFIGLAAVIDFLDGFVARAMKATSEMGKQLDSLADVVSFGVAPSMILYQFLRLGFSAYEASLDVPFWWLLPALLPAAGAAYRLAKFNLDTRQTEWFRGVPTPAAGLFVASLPLIYWNSDVTAVILAIKSPWLIISIALILTILMVSELPMLSFKFGKGSRSNLSRIILLSLVIPASLLHGWMAVPLIFLAYIILSLIFKRHAS